MDRTNLRFVVGFGFDNKPIMLYVGDSMADAIFAERVALQSSRFHHVNTYRNPPATKTFDLTEQKL
jgi:hypothetical protein